MHAVFNHFVAKTIHANALFGNYILYGLIILMSINTERARQRTTVKLANKTILCLERCSIHI